LGAMQAYTIATVLFPAALILFSVLLIIETAWRKKRTRKPGTVTSSQSSENG